jgi:calcineurin-like phosphoesterase family protein
MSEVFFIADTHFNHKRIVEIREKGARPEIREHRGTRRRARAALECHSREEDTVWHLGDFSFRKRGLQVADRLNGRKSLVLGNMNDMNRRTI